MAAMFSMVRTGRMYLSLPPSRKSRMVTGTKMMRDTSLVTNIEEKNTPKMRNKLRVVIRLRSAARATRGRNTFSRLNPSSTHSIMRSVPSVRQSMSVSRCFVGGVMIRATAAASNDTVSMGSFFKNPRTFCMEASLPNAFIPPAAGPEPCGRGGRR